MKDDLIRTPEDVRHGTREVLVGGCHMYMRRLRRGYALTTAAPGVPLGSATTTLRFASLDDLRTYMRLKASP